MDKYKEAIQAIKSNYPPSNYTMLRDGLDLAIEALEKQIPKKVSIKEWSPSKCPTCGVYLSENCEDGYWSHPTFLERCPNVDCAQRLVWD